MKLTLKDGTIIEKPQGTTPFEVAQGISEGLARMAMAASLNGKTISLFEPIEGDGDFAVLTWDSEGGQNTFRHTSSHVLAAAVKRLFPEAKFAIGPAIKDGFYYDIDCPTSFTADILEKIEEEMRKIVKEDVKLVRFTLPRAEALAWAQEQGEVYKVELINDLPEDAVISFYKMGDFTDLCAGPHLAGTGKIKAIKLTNSTGAYWRGDSSRPMLQRIYGTSFPKKADLETHLERLEEAKRRDHRKIGRELDLFGFSEEGPGFPFFYPKGMILRGELERYWEQLHRKAGYDEIKTPLILSSDLWHQSGHWDHYKDNMYVTDIDEGEFAIKPMNCPGAMLAFQRRMWSYKDMPLRVAERGVVHRHELSGALHGLFRVRCFTQDDAHIFMTDEQVETEIGRVIDLIDEVYTKFGFKYFVELSTCPEKFIGSDEVRYNSENTLKKVLENRGMEYILNEGDGAFYGPKIDFHLEDCLGRTWQCGTIQLDYQMPERFDLFYIGADGERHRPIMIHRVVYGSIERFIGILTEHYAGAFPTWLAPVHVKVLPITDRTAGYADEVTAVLEGKGFRAEVDHRSEKLGYKIREAQMQKIPYMIVVGDKEAAEGLVAVRNRSGEDLGTMTMADFMAKLGGEIELRA